MTDQLHLEASVRDNEGFREAPYLDSKRLWTVGIGRCLETNPLHPAEWRYLLATCALKVKITLEGAEWLMRRTLTEAQHECAKFDFWHRLDDVRQNVLIELVYQMGIDKLRGFKNMLAAVRAGDFDAAAEHGMDSKWAKIDSPARAQRLMQQLRTGALA